MKATERPATAAGCTCGGCTGEGHDRSARVTWIGMLAVAAIFVVLAVIASPLALNL